MDFAFILDPLPQLKAYKDSSIAMMRALAGRGHRIFAVQQPDVYWDEGATGAHATVLKIKGDDDWYESGEAEERVLKDFAAVIMRKDP
ncbi:MAG TPA: glutathione synthase, partial [Casimicrobiaceae bacterium]